MKGTATLNPLTDNNWFQRWVGLAPVKDHGTNSNVFFSTGNTDFATFGAAIDGYNISPFALTIPQGIGAHDRIGNEVNVIRDSYLIRFRLVPFVETNGASPYAWRSAWFVGERPIKIRLVALQWDMLQRPGMFGQAPIDLFKDPDSIESQFRSDQLSGYKVVFDETKTITCLPGTDSAAPAVAALGGNNKDNDIPLEAYFKFTTSYVREYAENSVTSPAVAAGTEIVNNSGNFSNEDGVLRGVVSWYVFIDDTYAPVCTTSSGAFPDYPPRFFPEGGMEMRVFRNVKYTDP